MSTRKTVSVQRVRELANTLLAQKSEVWNSEMKHGVVELLVDILHETGNYNGFRHHVCQFRTEKEEYDRTYY